MFTWRHSRCLFHRRLQSWSQSQSPWSVRVLLRTHTHNHRISFWMYNRLYHHRRRRVYLQSVYYTLQSAVQPGCTAGWTRRFKYSYTHTRLTALCPGLPGWAGTRKIKPIWISLKQETVTGSGISWAICKSAPRSRQLTTPAPYHSSFFYRPDALPATRPTVSKHWRHVIIR